MLCKPARLTALFLFALSSLRAQSAPAASPDFFENKIRPVLANNCYSCHTGSKLGGLRLDSRDAMLKGGKSGTALVPGDPDKSLMIRAVRQTGALKMPKDGKLTAAEIDGLVEWVKNGATWPAAAATTTAAVASRPTSANAPAASGAAYVITPERRAFWS